MGLLSNNPLTVTILNNDQNLFEGQVRSLSSRNNEGSFDILNSHSNFITIIQKQIKVRDLHNQLQTFNFERGVMQCYDNKVRIFLGI